MRLLSLPRTEGRLLFVLLVFLYCLLEVQLQDNDDRLFLVISNETDRCYEPMIKQRYVSTNMADPQNKDCEIIDTNLSQGADTCLSTRRDYGVGVCERVFANFSTGFNTSVSYEVMVVNTSDSRNDTFSNWDELGERLEGVERDLLMFQRILDRSLVGVYALSCENKSSCLTAYRQWLCVTRLPLFMLATNTNTQSADVIQDTDGTSYVRSKPCLSLCNRVAAQCPYFLPSSYQSDEPSELGNAIVYGGHAAFNCPTMKQVKANENCSSYSTNIDICIGNGAASLQSSTVMNRLCTLLTILVCVVVGIILR